jgi:hypothetical protein
MFVDRTFEKVAKAMEGVKRAKRRIALGHGQLGHALWYSCPPGRPLRDHRADSLTGVGQVLYIGYSNQRPLRGRQSEDSWT